MITSQDITHQVREATDVSDGDYDVDGIVRDIIADFGRVDIDSIDPDQFWPIVLRHAID